jgi:hypothetical protein
MQPEPKDRLADLLREIERHRAASREYRLSAYPEKRAHHELTLLSLYVEIGALCREYGLDLPPEMRGR